MFNASYLTCRFLLTFLFDFRLRRHLFWSLLFDLEDCSMFRRFLLILLLVGSSLSFVPCACAQSAILDLPRQSQRATVRQRVGITNITINYHRPLVNKRKMFGGLEPYGKVWRAGANENTTIEFSHPVSVEGQPLAKGVYGLHMIPNPDSWTVIFSKTNTGWGSYRDR